MLRAALKCSTGNDVTVILLDDNEANRMVEPTTIEVPGISGSARIQLVSLPYEQFIDLANSTPGSGPFPAHIKAVIATGSAQPYSTGARFAHANSIPVWIDVFGDPLAEIQTQFEINSPDQDDADQAKQIHVWKLLNDALLYGDRFSTLSERQRFALLGQLGCAGRLNQFTADDSKLVESIPYGLWEDDLGAEAPQPTTANAFTVLWAGSFNTWMDVPTLTKGLIDALKNDTDIRLVVVGGKIPGYNEISYNQFLEAIRQSGVEGAVTLLNWQPLSKMADLYRIADVGLSIDRQSYEAELGSRTRLVNLVAAGVPVISTVITELSHELADAGYLFPFEIGDAASLTNCIIQAKDNRAGLQAKRQGAKSFILQNYNGATQTAGLQQWLSHPKLAADKLADGPTTNNLFYHQANLRASLGV